MSAAPSSDCRSDPRSNYAHDLHLGLVASLSSHAATACVPAWWRREILCPAIWRYRAPTFDIFDSFDKPEERCVGVRWIFLSSCSRIHWLRVLRQNADFDSCSRRNVSSKSSAATSHGRWHYFASAAVDVDSSHMTASSSASWSRFSPPSDFVNWHVSTVWFMVCRWPQSQEGDWARPNSCKLARHGLWPVWKRFIRDHVWRGRWKPGCRILWSVTVVCLTTEADDQSSLHCVIVSTDVTFGHIGNWDAS